MKQLKGGNLDIDLIHSQQVPWAQDPCPWNVAENTNTHKCAIKNTSICKYFQSIKDPDIVLCTYDED